MKARKVYVGTLTVQMIHLLHNGYREGTATDAIGRHLCRVALGELCIGDDIPGGFRYPTVEEVREAKERLAAAWNARNEGASS